MVIYLVVLLIVLTHTSYKGTKILSQSAFALETFTTSAQRESSSR